MARSRWTSIDYRTSSGGGMRWSMHVVDGLLLAIARLEGGLDRIEHD